jgi:serine 3-dehydrogenase
VQARHALDDELGDACAEAFRDVDDELVAVRRVDEDDEVMLETNVLGLVRMTRLVLAHMEDGRGHVVNLGSWAGREAYPQGGMYVGSKYAVRALTYVLRKELVGRIKVSTVDPGMVGDTEFSDVRFRGDQGTAGAVVGGRWTYGEL